MQADQVITGDCRDVLPRLIAAGVRVQTCITSPPYYGLRDYGLPGQIGLEQTMQDYLAALLQVFRLVHDLLADDGTLWLNLGDSYSTGFNRGAAEKPDGYPVAAGVGLARRWLVSPPGHHLAQKQPAARIGNRPLHARARVPIPP